MFWQGPPISHRTWVGSYDANQHARCRELNITAPILTTIASGTLLYGSGLLTITITTENLQDSITMVSKFRYLYPRQPPHAMTQVSLPDAMPTLHDPDRSLAYVRSQRISSPAKAGVASRAPSVGPSCPLVCGVSAPLSFAIPD